MKPETKSEKDLLQKLRAYQQSGKPVRATLSTDERVLARISDGIYRQPSSALRELIANAYDADATQVTIQTDPPRFGRISVKDNGMGMNEQTLVRLIHHIGGSPKRNRIGQELGLTDPSDPSLTPQGRKIIGKIGIGLFSVAQLTRRFSIFTKQAGSKYRLVATVELRTYSEDDLEAESGSINTGTVQIYSAPANDTKSHGTEIILDGLHASAKDLLCSRDIWERQDAADEGGDNKASLLPTWHIGRVDPQNCDRSQVSPNVPWKAGDSAKDKFEAVYNVIGEHLTRSGPKPSLENTFDRYFQTIWNLSLAAPLEYMDGTHPFDLPGDSFTRVFLLSNKPKTSATEIIVGPKTTIRKAFAKKKISLLAPQSPTTFAVFFDGIELARPIRFRYPWGFDADKPKTHPLLFIGKCSPPVGTLPPEVSGGSELSFETYFMLSKLILPKDHIGVMVRIANNSGTLFDQTFFGYKIQEVIRMQKISSEVFLLEGLDAALNIDRESYNYGHPHSKILMSWVHRAIRQITNIEKSIGKEANKQRQITKLDEKRDSLERRVRSEAEAAGVDFGSIREVNFTSDDAELHEHRKDGELALNSSRALPAQAFASTKNAVGRRLVLEAQATALTQVLDAHNLLEGMTYIEIERLIKSIMEIFSEG